MAAEGTIWGGAIPTSGCASRIPQGRKNVQILPGSVDFKIRSNAPLLKYLLSRIFLECNSNRGCNSSEKS